MGKKGRPLDPRMPTDTRPSTQRTFLACGRTVDIYPLPLTQTCSGRRPCRLKFVLLFMFFRGGHLYYGPNLVGVGLNISLRHHKPLEISYRHSKGTLAWIKLHVVGVKGVKHL